MALDPEKFFTVKIPTQRLHLKGIKRLIENAPSTEGKEKLMQLKKTYIVFLCFFWLSILLFVINLIEVNRK